MAYPLTVHLSVQFVRFVAFSKLQRSVTNDPFGPLAQGHGLASNPTFIPGVFDYRRDSGLMPIARSFAAS